MKGLAVTLVALSVTGCGAAATTRSGEDSRVQIEQRTASGDTVHLTARDRSDARTRVVCGTLTHLRARTGDDFCLKARSPDHTGIATVFVSRGHEPAISAALLVSNRAREVTLETADGQTRQAGELSATKPGYALGVIAVAGTTKRVLPVRLVVRDGRAHVLMRSDWIPRDTCQSTRLELRACTLQLEINRVA